MESAVQETVEYVQLLENSVYDQYEDSQQNVQIQNTTNTIHNIVTTDNSNDVEMMDNYEEIQYIEAEEVEIDDTMLQYDNKHTIIVHEGRQYVIPTEQLNSGNHTIILDEEDGLPIQEDNINNIQTIIDNSDNNEGIYYTEIDDNITSIENTNLEERNVSAVKQYAILKDGKLHITNNLETTDDNKKVCEIQEKLRQFENSLINFEEGNECNEGNHRINCSEQKQIEIDNERSYDEDNNDDEDDDGNNKDDIFSEITGRNLITGQTISLNGFLEKMRRKNDISELMQTPKRRNHIHLNESQEYVSVPPVNRRVVVGKTQDGKRLVGRILQIQKKIQPIDKTFQIKQTLKNTFTITMPRMQKKINEKSKPTKLVNADRFNEISNNIRKEEKNTESAINPYLKLRYVPRSELDESVARTLSGLMDMESINKRLKGRRVIVKHVQRCSNDGKVIAGSRRIAYYCGHMKKSSVMDTWSFVLENIPKNSGIDLPQKDMNNSDKINVRLSELETMISDSEISTGNEIKYDDSEDSSCDEVEKETITLYLTETQDEYGKKKTKVTIPHLGNSNHSIFANNVIGNGLTTSNKNKSKQIVSASASNSTSSELFVSNDHICEHCGKKFQTLGSLRRHATVHDHSLRPLQCMTCMGRFTDESSLKKHMILHTGLRPHKCTMCDKTFAHRGDLNFHLRTHDPVKRYECSICKKQFNRHSNMIRHAEIHRPQLTRAGSASASASGTSINQLLNVQAAVDNESMLIVEQQLEKNNEEKQEVSLVPTTKTLYTCDECGIQYNFSSSLTRHIVNAHINNSNKDTNTIIT